MKKIVLCSFVTDKKEPSNRLERRPLDSYGISETGETLQERSDEAARRSPRGKRAVSLGKHMPALFKLN